MPEIVTQKLKAVLLLIYEESNKWGFNMIAGEMLLYMETLWANMDFIRFSVCFFCTTQPFWTGILC